MSKQPRAPAGQSDGGQWVSIGGPRSKVPAVGFHLTEIENLESIAQEGLKAYAPKLGMPQAVFFVDDLYPEGHEYSIETALSDWSVTLKAKLSPRKFKKVFDDAEVREFTGVGGGQDSSLGPETAFATRKGVAPENLFVVLPAKDGGKRQTIPLQKFVKGPGIAALKKQMEAADAEIAAKYGKGS